MSKLVQEPSQASTPSVSAKLQKPAKAGDTPQKSPDEGSDKALPVKAIYFDKVVKWPGLAGAASSIVVGKPTNISQNAMYCDSIFLYRGKFIVNGKHFMHETAGPILCYEF